MRSLTTRAIMALAIPAGLIACSESPTNPSCVVHSVLITGAPAALEVGATVQLNATVDSDDCSTAPTVSWSTSAESRATVSNAGLVTGAGAGSVTITASAGGKSGTATFDITLTPVASVRVSTEEIVIGVGPAHTLTAQALDEDDNVLAGRNVTWSVTGGTGATIATNGMLTGVTPGGTATVTASVEGIEADVTVHVVRSRLAFFWNNLATPGGTPVVPNTLYSYNSLGGALSVASGSVGDYSASFEGQGRQNFETEAYFLSTYSAPAGSYCTNGGWSSTNVTVNCFDAAGAPANMRFTVAHISSATFGGRSAFSWIPSGAGSVEGHTDYRYNPTGGGVFSTRNGAGDYTVRFEGLGRQAASDREGVIVNSYDTDATCQPASWTTTGEDLDVAVRCFGPGGAAADAQFSVLVVDGARAGATLAFAHADQPATGAYPPANSAVRPTGTAQVNRNSTGQYSVAFTGVFRTGDLRETFLVSVTGTTPGRCQIAEWEFSGSIATSTNVFVSCSTPAGVPADLPFSVVVLQ